MSLNIFEIISIVSPLSIIIFAVILFVLTNESKTLKRGIAPAKARILLYLVSFLIINIIVVFTMCELFKDGDSEGAGWVSILNILTDTVVTVMAFILLLFAKFIIKKTAHERLVLWKKNFKRTVLIVAVLVLYVIGISSALVSIPFQKPPDFLESIFSTSYIGTLAWIKIRHSVIVLIVGGVLSLLIVKFNKDSAQLDAIIIGALTILYSVIFKYVVVWNYGLLADGFRFNIFTWFELTDYLVMGACIPALVAIIRKKVIQINPRIAACN